MSTRRGYNIKNQFAAHFLTFTTVGWIDIFTRKCCRDMVIKSFQYCIENTGMRLHAFVIMSNHLHIVISAKDESIGLSAIVRDMKKYLSKSIIRWVLNSRRESRKDWIEVVLMYHAKYNTNNKTYQLWQQHNKPMELWYPKIARQKIDYIHINPVKANIVDKPEDYLYSSARNYLGRDDYLIDVDILDLGSDYENVWG